MSSSRVSISLLGVRPTGGEDEFAHSVHIEDSICPADERRGLESVTESQLDFVSSGSYECRGTWDEQNSDGPDFPIGRIFLHQPIFFVHAHAVLIVSRL